FRESVLALDKVYASVVGSSLIESTGLFSADSTGTPDALEDQWPISIVLPALTMLQLALVDTLAAVGVSPDIVIGHSAGETAVLSASGAASKSAALELAITRGQVLSLVEEARGMMAAVTCSAKDAQRIINEVNGELGTDVLIVGCFNAPDAVTLSGTESHIDFAVTKVSAVGIFARKLKTHVPVHFKIMELCHAAFEKLVADVFSRHDVSPPTVTVYSTVTGRVFDHAFDAAYYWDGMLGAVQFKDAIQALLSRNKSATFIKIRPHPVLAAYLQTMSQHHNNITITCPFHRPRMLEPGIEMFKFVTSLGKVVTAGHGVVEFDVLYGSATTYTGPIPRYPFALRSVPWSVATLEC
ncbi:acyl transferase domain-containing protein, partial [Fomes fomentarius]